MSQSRTKEEEQLRQEIKDLNKQKAINMTVKVTAIDDSLPIGPTCTVEIAESVLIYRVRLRSVTGSKAGFLIIPVIGSYVIISRIGLSNEWYVSMFSEVEEIRSETVGKISILNTVENLKTIMNDLLAAIEAITVTTPAGPSGPPINIADFIAINLRINNLLSDGT